METIMYRLGRRSILTLLLDPDLKVLSLRIGSRKIGRIDFEQLAEGARFDVDGKTLVLKLDEMHGFIFDELQVVFNGKDVKRYEEKGSSLTSAGGLLALYGLLQCIGVLFLQRYFPIESTLQLILTVVLGGTFIALGILTIWKETTWPAYVGVGIILIGLLVNALLGTLSFTGAIVPLVVVYVVVKNVLMAG